MTRLRRGAKEKRKSNLGPIEKTKRGRGGGEKQRKKRGYGGGGGQQGRIIV